MKKSAIQSFLELYPWLDESDLKPSRTAPARPRHAAKTSGADGDMAASGSEGHARAGEDSASELPEGAPPRGAVVDGGPDEGWDHDPADVMAELADVRAEWAANDDLIHFYVRVRGGDWTFRHRGTVADSVGRIGRAHTHAWCTRFGWSKTKSLSRTSCTAAKRHISSLANSAAGASTFLSCTRARPTIFFILTRM